MNEGPQVEHPSQSDYCRVARDSAGDLFEARHALIAGVALTLLSFAGLAVAIPYGGRSAS